MSDPTDPNAIYAPTNDSGAGAPQQTSAQSNYTENSNMPMSGTASSGTFAGITGAGMATSLVSAYIQSLDPDLPLPPITFPYNPDTISITHSSSYKSATQTAGNGPVKQFQGVSTEKVSVNILLDQFSVPPPLAPISTIITQIKMFLLPTDISKAAGNATAPTVVFGWGPNIIMDQAVISKVIVNYQRFLLGVPVRANVSVTLDAVPLPSPLGPTNPTSGGLASRRSHRMVEGETLASVAFREYRNPNKWRVLAEANGIDDPMRVKPGTELIVPAKREAEAIAGQE